MPTNYRILIAGNRVLGLEYPRFSTAPLIPAASGQAALSPPAQKQMVEPEPQAPHQAAADPSKGQKPKQQ